MMGYRGSLRGQVFNALVLVVVVREQALDELGALAREVTA